MVPATHITASRRTSVRALLGAIAVAAVVALTLVANPTAASADTPSDSRASFFGGNVTTCAAIGFGSSIQVGSSSNSNAADANVSGEVETNAGTVNPGQGQELDVTITPAGVTAGVVIDAVMVKGGNGYNVYTDPAVLPPTLAPDQHYISPFNNGGNIPTISHWFVCYHLGAPPVGSLSVFKVVQPPSGVPVAPLPSSFSATVNCDDNVHTNVQVTFGAGGGAGNPSSITGIPVGSVCTVVENETNTFPPGTVVTYNPTGADTTGVTIGDTSGVSVTIDNDFTGIEVQTGTLRVIKNVVNDNGGTAGPDSFNLHVQSDGIDVTGSPAPGIGPPTGRDYVLPIGTYTVGEDSPANYTFTGFSGDCDDSGGVTVVTDQTVTCTLTNDDIPPELTVIKDVINDGGGSAVASDWTMEVTGTNVASPSFPGAESPGVTTTLNAGTYSVDESGGPSGYAQTLSADCSGSIGVGESKTCTITNDDVAAQLIVIKHVVNDNGGTAVASNWTMNVDDAGANPAPFPGAESPGVTVPVDAGPYSVDESGGPSGYTKTLSPDCSGTIAVGETKTCTITNDDIAPQLTVIKHVVNDNGGTALASNWAMNVDDAGANPAPFPGAESPGVTVPVDAGPYSVDESGGPSGYAKTASADCSGSIGVGETKTCTITNDDIAPQLTVIKHVTGGPAVAADFTMHVEAANVVPSASFPGNETGTTVTLDAGAFHLTESGPTGYDATSTGCVGTLGVGEHATCVVTNTYHVVPATPVTPPPPVTPSPPVTGTLAFTGGNAGALAAIGAVMVGAGLLLVLAARRRPRLRS
jgi:hypothetical protein